MMKTSSKNKACILINKTYVLINKAFILINTSFIFRILHKETENITSSEEFK